MSLKKINLDGDLLGLDFGDSRTGVARIHPVARISEPLSPIVLKGDVILVEEVAELIRRYNPSALVIGLPRGLDGQETEQTKKVEKFAKQMEDIKTGVPLYLVDEAGTTKEAELRVKKGESVDSVAACIILETFVSEVERGRIADVTF